MAGFDVTFSYSERDEALVDACLLVARRRARTLGVRIHTARPAKGHLYLRIDGQTYGLDIYLERLRRDLPTVAEATTSGRAPGNRRKVALGLIDILWRARLGMYDRYPEMWVPRLRARSAPAYVLPHQIYAPEAPRLQQRMSVTMDLLASWHFGEVAPEVLLEEIHTAAELLLEGSVNARVARLSFAQLVDKAAAEGLLYAPVEHTDLEFSTAYRDYRERAAAKAKRVLILLKDTRKNVRHRNAGDAGQWLDAHFWDAAAILEHLAPHARDRESK